MNVLLLYLIILNLCNNSKSICQLEFATHYVSNLYKDLPADCRYVPGEYNNLTMRSLTSKSIINNRETKINYYLSGNKIEDIGIAIFDSTIRKLIPSEDIARFVERKTLELLLISNESSFIGKIHENDIYVLIDDNPVLNQMGLQKAYSIMIARSNFNLKRDSLRYMFHWGNNKNESVTFSFPATNTLIRSMDKKELDEEIIHQLEEIHFGNLEKKEKILSTKNILKSNLIPMDSIYYMKGDIFVIKEINSNLYFELSNHGLRYIFDPKYVKESLCNLIQFPALNDDLKANINHNIYGNEQVKYTMKFYDLMEYFKKNCLVYTGIEKESENGIEALVILYNNKLNVIHIITINVNNESIFEGDKAIKIGLRTNIPTNNIYNLFGEYIPQETQFEVLIK